MPQANRLSLPTSSPQEQLRSRTDWNAAREEGLADFFTVGYSGRSLETILESLQAHGVQTLLDIRQNAVSMYRPEMSKKNLSNTLRARGVEYIHLAHLGVPRDIRAKAIAAGRRDVIWTWYDQYVVPEYLRLHAFLNSYVHPVALMCSELDPCECHRHRASLALEALGLRSYDI